MIEVLFMLDRQKILDFIKEEGVVTSKEVADKFSISESTARRALSQLDAAHKIKRRHGVAFISDSAPTLMKASGDYRIHVNYDLKHQVALKAASLIQDNQTLILLTGSAVYHLAHVIRDKHITVITNSMLVFQELQHCSNIELIILGGYYNRSEGETSGYITNSSLSYYRSDYLFMGTCGFDEYSGFSHSSYSIDIFRACLQSCRYACVLADSTKYNKTTASISAKPSDISYLFCDRGLSPSVGERFKELYNVEVLYPDVSD